MDSCIDTERQGRIINIFSFVFGSLRFQMSAWALDNMKYFMVFLSISKQKW